MLDGGIIQRLLEEKWKTFARVSSVNSINNLIKSSVSETVLETFVNSFGSSAVFIIGRLFSARRSR